MYGSLEEILAVSKQSGLPFWKVVQLEDCREEDITEETSFEKMREMYRAMRDTDQAYDPALQSASGLVGTDGAKVRERRLAGKLLSGDLMGLVMERALRTAESNACMKRIVAAPTAGSCGVMPAVLLTIQEHLQLGEERMTEALYTAAGIGGVIALRASLSGAEGGCQAEIGSASAMTAGAVVYLSGGSASQMTQAAALALKGLLGLACDPVAGLVEVGSLCQTQRNWCCQRHHQCRHGPCGNPQPHSARSGYRCHEVHRTRDVSGAARNRKGRAGGNPGRNSHPKQDEAALNAVI